MPEKTGTRGYRGKKAEIKGKKRRKDIFGAIRILFLFGFILFVFLGIGALVLVYPCIKDVPEFDPHLLKPDVTSYIFDDSGKEIANLYYDQNRVEIPLESIPLHVQKAFIAIEDERFYDHFGVDPVAILRALASNIKNRNWTDQGGSTITQQIIKTAFLTPQKTYRRKIQEAWLALKMERQYSKSEILEIYLNQIPFAQGAYGIEAASTTYFNKPAQELTLAEAALLATIPRSPNYYSPFVNFEAAKQRQSLVLQNMHRLGFISHREMTAARNEEIILGEPPTRQYEYPYFVDYVLHHELINILTSLPQYKTREEAYEAVYNMGLKIYTTLNTNAQKETENVLNNESLYPQNLRVDMDLLKEMMKDKSLNSYPKEVLGDEGLLQPQAAAVVANPATGEILALVGGREYSKGNQSLRYLSRRQPGSAIKPIAVYAPAMEENLITPGSIIDDAPFIRGSWAPENFDRRFRGLVTIREALVPSLNVAAVKTFAQLTPEIGLSYLKQMGVSSIQDGDYNLATAIGGMTQGISPLDMAQAYAVLANQGIKVNLHTIKRIEDRSGQILFEQRSEPQSILSPQTAYMITDILKDVVRRGTAARLRVGRPVAAKTGTTSDNRDAYLVAYTPDLVVSFWMGHDIPTTGKISGGSGTTIPFMNAIISSVLKDKEPTDFSRPSGVTGPVSICSKSGLRPGPFCPPETITSEIFPSSQVPQGTCNLHMEMGICTISGLLAGEHCSPQSIESQVFLLRPEYEVTDERWRGAAGRVPEDASQQPPEEHCQGHHLQPGPGTDGFAVSLLDQPPRAYLWWSEREDIQEYFIYRKSDHEEEFTLLRNLPGNANQFLDGNITAGNTYTYKLAAITTEGVRLETAGQVLIAPDAPGSVRENNSEQENNGNEQENGGDDENAQDEEDLIHRQHESRRQR
ncbi:MAG TPA: PBP1A family penicillin-binding protein [Firmicutes bacterium]|jgi:penicillin-binding protein 1A|nr:PBP1A family penicillin-binding protein [Bacillota bacterium]